MEVYSDLLPATKSEPKGAGFDWTPATDNELSQVAGTLLIKQKRVYTTYIVSEFVADVGRGFLLAKASPGSDKSESHYSALIAPHGASMCECRGWQATGNCKHLAALVALIDGGKL